MAAVNGEGESAKAVKLAATLERGGGGGKLSVEAVRSGPYAVSLSDELGISSRPEPLRQVIVRSDAPPVVAVRGPEDASEASSNDTVGLGIAARDDVAVASVELHYTIERRDSASGDAENGHRRGGSRGAGLAIGPGERGTSTGTAHGQAGGFGVYSGTGGG